MWQEIVVGIIVVLAALHACTKYLPSAWRRQIVYLLSRRGFNQDRLAKIFKTQSSCGDGCDTCGSCEPEAPPEPDSRRRVIKIHKQ
ncbi:DUF6587 family protein [Massilia endophytica]|uniref:DUF6587 family protein n=1 Tax=Massilia endophytica TaxID=2899220 RepID=UPI001E42543E|nr:DUF6587 family protein [Massilia endophytica]UGQ45986.1 hypothetical protein LSQ66_19695 [Massilia endophytica]